MAATGEERKPCSVRSAERIDRLGRSFQSDGAFELWRDALAAAGRIHAVIDNAASASTPGDAGPEL